MDATKSAAAYRCIPLAMANEHGWEMLCPFAFEAMWTGGTELQDVVVHPDDPERAKEYPRFAVSHFATAVLTFNPQLVIRTSPGYDLWLTGPINSFKDGLHPMTALVEADWMPYTFAMSWLFTRPNHPVRFEEGEPFCTFFPIPRNVVEDCDPQIKSLGDAQEIHEQYEWALARRKLDELLDAEPSFQNWYTKGTFPKGDAGGAPTHRTGVRAKPFKR